MEAFQERVIQERIDLGEKLIKLNGFMRSSTFTSLDEYEQERLRRQYEAMITYADILEERINRFEQK